MTCPEAVFNILNVRINYNNSIFVTNCVRIFRLIKKIITKATECYKCTTQDVMYWFNFKSVNE